VLPQIYPTDKSGQKRPLIRTFAGRKGRLSETRLNILETLLPKYAIAPDLKSQDYRQVLDSSEVIIDFGAGMGQHSMALLAKGKAVVAIDVHTAGICDVVGYAQNNGHDKLRVFHGDGIGLLLEGIQQESISEVHVYFPDPWPKARHANRRLFTVEFLEMVSKVLVPNGKVLLVTDIDEYADGAREVISQTKQFKEVEFSDEVTMTSFHKRALKLGHRIYKFALKKV
jgi:tRNA (guanine-N7-)-methyltransferase